MGVSCGAGHTWFGMGLFLFASVLCCALDWGERGKKPQKDQRKKRQKERKQLIGHILLLQIVYSTNKSEQAWAKPALRTNRLGEKSRTCRCRTLEGYRHPASGGPDWKCDVTRTVNRASVSANATTRTLCMRIMDQVTRQTEPGSLSLL